MTVFRLSARSLEKLEGVHPDLARVPHRAIEITPVDFGVIWGVRTIEEQRQLVRSGMSKTMNSRHLIQPDGFAHAFDVVAYVDGKVAWTPWSLYEQIAKAMKIAAKELDVPIEWGGDWKTFKDGPHFQLPKGYKGD